MSRWFRFYDDVINDPKVLKLSDSAFRGWVSLLCVASKLEGKFPSVKDIAFYLRTKPNRVALLLAELQSAGLIDKVGDTFEPHNWGGRQYISDSTQRVKRHREKRAAAGLAPQWQPTRELREQVYASDGYKCVYCSSSDDLTIDHKIPEMRGGTHVVANLQTACRRCNASKRDLTHDEFVSRNVTSGVTRPLHETRQSTEYRTDPDAKKRVTRASALADPWVERDRERFWEQYPNKVGKADAMKALDKASRKVAPDELFRALQAYAHKTDDRPFCNPATWLNQERWLDKPAMNANGQRGFNPSNRPSSNDFFAGMRSVAEDIAGNGEPSRPAYEDIPRGRVNIEH